MNEYTKEEREKVVEIILSIGKPIGMTKEKAETYVDTAEKMTPGFIKREVMAGKGTFWTRGNHA